MPSHKARHSGKAFLLFFLALALAGCTVFAAQPTADPNAGGGRIGAGEPAGQPRNSGSQDAGGGKTNPSEFAAPEGNPALASGAPTAEMDPLKPGGAITRGAATFTLDSVTAGASDTTITWQVSGLPAGYEPSGEEPVTVIELQSGALLPAIGAQGSVSGTEGGSAVETARLTFSPLPAGTRMFTLMVPNTWTGTSETWIVPVVLE